MSSQLQSSQYPNLASGRVIGQAGVGASPSISNMYRPVGAKNEIVPFQRPSTALSQGGPFDAFQRAGANPPQETSFFNKTGLWLPNPLKTGSLLKLLSANTEASGEDVWTRIQMYRQLRKNLNKAGRKNLDNLLQSQVKGQSVLTDCDSEDGHSTLHHLYGILTDPKAAGFNNRQLLHEALKVLNRPYTITQKAPDLTDEMASRILEVKNNPHLLNPAGEKPLNAPLSWKDLKIQTSATCVASSVMYYMAEKQPSELARHLKEASGPAQLFVEKAKLSDIYPEDPQSALQILKDNNVDFQPIGADEVAIKVHVPRAAYLRAVSDSNNPNKPAGTRNGIETLYQMALTYLANPYYDAATDTMRTPEGADDGKGLTEEQKTLMQTIIQDNGGIQSVTYQVAAGKANPQTEAEQSLPYLYGYTRSFDQTAGDLVSALKMGEFVIVGITYTEADGSIVGGHEITLTSAFVDPKDNQLKFVVVDSDDGKEYPVIWEASKLIPMIHHAGLPTRLAQGINQEISESPNYLVPGRENASRYTLVSVTPDPLPQEATEGEAPVEQTPPAAPQPTQPSVQQSQPTIQYVAMPVYSYYYPQQPMVPANYANAFQMGYNPTAVRGFVPNFAPAASFQPTAYPVTAFRQPIQQQTWAPALAAGY